MYSQWDFWWRIFGPIERHMLCTRAQCCFVSLVWFSYYKNVKQTKLFKNRNLITSLHVNKSTRVGQKHNYFLVFCLVTFLSMRKIIPWEICSPRNCTPGNCPIKLPPFLPVSHPRFTWSNFSVDLLIRSQYFFTS